MRIACAGDAHGNRMQMEKLLETLPPVDAFCFLGDCDRDAETLHSHLMKARPGMLFHAVAGNNDPCSIRAKTMELPFDNNRVLLTHGHLFRVKLTTAVLADYANKRGCHLALYGHTHRPQDEIVDGVRLVNPGALQNGQWALIETGEVLRVRLLTL